MWAACGVVSLDINPDMTSQSITPYNMQHGLVHGLLAGVPFLRSLHMHVAPDGATIFQQVCQQVCH
jgi:hypothetical protein